MRAQLRYRGRNPKDMNNLLRIKVKMSKHFDSVGVPVTATHSRGVCLAPVSLYSGRIDYELFPSSFYSFSLWPVEVCSSRMPQFNSYEEGERLVLVGNLRTVAAAIFALVGLFTLIGFACSELKRWLRPDTSSFNSQDYIHHWQISSSRLSSCCWVSEI